MFRLHSKIPLAVLALAICTGTLQASATLVATPTSITLACDTTTGAVSNNVGIKLAAAGSSVTVTPSVPSGSPVTVPSAAAVASTTAAVNFSFGVSAGCAGAYNGQQVIITFTPSTGTALTVTATLSITGATLVASPTSLTLNCDTGSGPIAGSVGIKLKATGPTGGFLVTPSYSSATGMGTLPAAASVTSTSTATTFSFSVAAACAGATNGQTLNIIFTPAVGQNTGTVLQVPVTISVTSPVLTSSVGSAITLNCDTVLGPTPASIGITLAGGTTAYPVAASSAANTVVLVNPSGSSPYSVSSTTVPVVWGVHGAAGCKGWVNGATVALTFTPTGGEVLTVTATLALTTNTATALAASPSSVIITCTKNGSTYGTPSTQIVNVTSPANYGTPFTIDTTTGHAPPAYLSVTGSGTASSTAVALTVTAVSGCGNLPVGNTVTSFSLANSPAADLVVPVTIQVGAASAITATSVALTYVKGSGTYNAVSTTLSGTSGLFYQVDTTTLPLWLNAATTSGTTPTGVSFLPTAGAETLALGTYSASVHLKVSGYLDSVVAVSLQVKSASESIVLSEGLSQSTTWILGQAPPTFTITPISTGDAPVAYTVTSAATAHGLVPQVSSASGVAYSFGPALGVSFLQAPFSAATPGEVLSGTVTITWTAGGGGSAIVTFTVTAMSPSATITSISPSSLPTATSGTFNAVITGSGFVTAPTGLVTNVGVVSGGFVIPDSNIVATVENATTIDLVITVPANPDSNLPFTGTGGTAHIAVCNPVVTTTPCFTPTSSVNLTIGINPIVQSVSSASSFIQATPPALPAVAPYDMLSLFGTNFCISNSTGCTGGAPILYGQKDPATLRYLTQLSPDASGSGQRNLTVTFQTHSASPTVIAQAPLLFATNNQINLLVPDAVKAYYGNTVDMVVSFGYGSGATMLSSNPYSMTVTPTDPGVFAMTGDGQGDAAALSVAYALINQANPAGANASTADMIELYVTGLGRPDGPGTTFSSTCMATDAYWAAVNAAVNPGTPLTSDDGLVLQSAYYPASTIGPCMSDTSTNLPTVTVGGVSAPVEFAGWVTGSVAGLSQINVQLPTSAALGAASSPVTLTTTAQSLPIVVTANGKTSQPSGLNVWMVKSPSVVVTNQTFSIAAGLLSTSPAPQPFAVTGGAGPTFSVTNTGSGALPPGITMNSDGSLAGTPTTAGTYNVIVNVMDTNGWSGTLALTITITT